MMEKLWIPLLSVAVGALLGGVINAMVGRYSTFKEGKGIAAALHSEIESILFMIKHRQYVQHLTEILARLSDPKHVVTAADVPAISVTQDYFSVFHAIASKIGLLGELGGPVTRLYVLGKGVIEDLGVLQKWHEEGMTPTREDLRDILEAVRFLFETIDREGQQMMMKLDEYASRRRHWLLVFS